MNRKKNLRTFDKTEDVKFVADPAFDKEKIKMCVLDANTIKCFDRFGMCDINTKFK